MKTYETETPWSTDDPNYEPDEPKYENTNKTIYPERDYCDSDRGYVGWGD